ncbi:helix-turn-helix domain-containing protein [Streptomyces sp. NPDC056132]|uniref:MmyB family transcriptional regulator n=1 Tax=Streptomyces sp. NPDC056132 TaxID=3345722 RepID=UPI0035DFC799
MDKAALKNLLEQKRAEIRPEDMGLPRPSARQGRRAPGLTQSQIERLLNRADGVYQRLESGRYANPPADLIQDVARLLGMNEHEWDALWRYATGTEAPHPLHPSSGQTVSDVWLNVLPHFSDMAYINNESWEVLGGNDVWKRLFPDHTPPQNTMRWMLLHPDAHRILTDWETAWAPLVIPQLRAALASRPDDEILRTIEKDVLADPVVGPLYKSVPDRFVTLDGDERPLLHPEHGPSWVTVCAAEPVGSPGARLIILRLSSESRLGNPTPQLKPEASI